MEGDERGRDMVGCPRGAAKPGTEYCSPRQRALRALDERLSKVEPQATWPSLEDNNSQDETGLSEPSSPQMAEVEVEMPELAPKNQGLPASAKPT